MKKFWFKPKKYGYGFYPISLEGWLATTILLGLVFASAYANDMFTEKLMTKNILVFLVDVIIIASLSIIFFKDRCDGEVKWRWGGKN